MWHATRFIESATKVRCACAVCACPYWLPPSKAPRYLTCSEECAAKRRAALVAPRTRPCATCGEPFTPRSTQLAEGHGRFCSQACNTASRDAMLAPESRARAVAGSKAAFASGRYVPKNGVDHPHWQGGPAAYRARAQAAGALAKRTREWRRRNPEAVREFVNRRVRLCAGKRLPKGTVARIGAAQRWRCAVCAHDIRHVYHLDHRTPLARGGEHEPGNIQLLCPTCNVRKAAKDPITFMQERGFLL